MVETSALLPDAKVVFEIVDVICVKLKLDTGCQALVKELALVGGVGFRRRTHLLVFFSCVRPTSVGVTCMRSCSMIVPALE